ncbi:MAG TPA: YezD family protein [Nitrospiria bacterium]|nr:YezD family protein [Nitrospiria bacterium]
MTENNADRPSDTPRAPDRFGRPEIVAQILKALQTIEFGSIQIIIHDSAVVQIERTEKIRFDRRNRHGAT